MIRENRGIILALGGGLFAIIAIVTAVTTTLNRSCQSTFWDNMQVYPDAQMVSQQAEFLGIQRAVYYTPDPVALVNEWYRAEHAAQMRSALDNLNLDNLPSENWVVESTDGQEGSTLTLETTCP